MKMKLAFLLMISTLFHHGFNTKITMLEKKEIFVSEDDEPNYETENNKVRVCTHLGSISKLPN